MEVVRYKGRHWAVYDEGGELVVVTVYKRGANEVKRRLFQAPEENAVSPAPERVRKEQSFSRNKRQ